MDLNQLQQQMNQSKQSMAKYEDPTLSANVRAEIAKAYEPVLKSSTDATQRMMGDFNVRYSNIPYMGNAAGTGAESLTPQQKMEIMNRELGTMGGRLSSASALTNALGGSLNTMQGNAIQDISRAQEAAARKYQQDFDQYKLAWEADQRQKDREQQERLAAAQRAAAAAARRTSRVNVQPFNPFSKAPGDVRNALSSRDPNALYNAMKQWEQSSGGYNPDVHEAGWYAWREMNYGPGAGAAGQSAIDSGRWKR